VSVAAAEIRAVDPQDEPGADPPATRASRLSGTGSAGGRHAETARLRVLLVEDEPSMRLLCTFNLELGGFEVTSVETGAEGLARASEGGFDLLLLDVMLPDLGGFEVAQRLRESAEAPCTPVVFLSARGSETDLARGRAAGAIDYVVKPFDPVALPHRLRDDLAELARSGADAVRRRRFGGRSGEPDL